MAEERKVQLALEETPFAIRYEVELSDKTKVLRVMKFNTHELSFKAEVGSYLMRARSFDKRGLTSPWTAQEVLEIPPATPLVEKSPPAETLADEKSLKAKLDFKWKPSVGASHYIIETLDAQGKVTSSITSKETSFSTEVPPGTYSFAIKAVGKDDVISESAQNLKFVVKGAKLKPVEFATEDVSKERIVRWKSENLAANYNLSFERSDLDTDDWESVNRTEQVTEKEFKIPADLAPGKYRISVKSESQGWTSSDVTSHEFLVKPTLREISSVPE